MRIILVLISLFPLLTSIASAKDASYELTIKDHRFTPDTLTIPSGQKVKIHIKNQDSTVEEFESTSLKREKIIPGNSEATLLLGPLKTGSYEFVGEFHAETAKGTIIVQ